MNLLSGLALVLAWLAILGIAWLGWQLLRQNGRLLLRLEELEKRLNELEFGGAEEPEGLPLGTEALGFELPDLVGKSRTLAEFCGQPYCSSSSIPSVVFAGSCCRNWLG